MVYDFSREFQLHDDSSVRHGPCIKYGLSANTPALIGSDCGHLQMMHDMIADGLLDITAATGAGAGAAGGADAAAAAAAEVEQQVKTEPAGSV